MVDDVAIIANGRLVTSGPIETLRGTPTATVRTPNPEGLREALRRAGLTVTLAPDHLVVDTADLARIGELAFAAGIPVHELSAHRAALEDLYFRLTLSPEHHDRNRLPA